MKKTYSKEFMQNNCECYPVSKMESIFFNGNNDFITADDIINSSIPLKDKFWFFCKKTGVEKIKNQELAIKLSEIVLPIFESKFPSDKRPKEAIEAAKLYISGHISLNELLNKINAAYAADACNSYKLQIEQLLIDFVNSQPETL